jgi:hypothetical protein
MTTDELIEKPPIRAWTEPKQCPTIEQFEARYGPLVAVRVRPSLRWWTIDDWVRGACDALQELPDGRPNPSENRGMCLGVSPSGWKWVPRQRLEGIWATLQKHGVTDEVQFRQVPPAGQCGHPKCETRRARERVYQLRRDWMKLDQVDPCGCSKEADPVSCQEPDREDCWRRVGKESP